MYREMRRKDREISKEAAINLLKRGEYGILATLGENDMPYAVPLSYVYVENYIYIHCANVGYKLDNIKENPKVSFCVVGETKVIPDKFSTAFESVIVFGTAEIIQDEQEKAVTLRAIVDKYSPDFKAQGEEYIKNASNSTNVVKINIGHITGKQRNV